MRSAGRGGRQRRIGRLRREGTGGRQRSQDKATNGLKSRSSPRPQPGRRRGPVRNEDMTHFPTPDHARLAETGMYRPDLESDACGVGLVTATDGKPSHRVLEAAIEALRSAWHRGAADADGKTGAGETGRERWRERGG